MTHALQHIEKALVHEIAPAYVASAPKACPQAIRQWRPTGQVWPMLRELQGRVIGLRKCRMEVDGATMVWLEGGNPHGEAVVLLHGFASSKENWLLLLPFLAKRYRLYVPDLPAWGESHFRHEKVYGLDQQADRIAQWARQILPHKAHFVGSSMGGGIAGLVAARHPDITATLTLMNAAGVKGNQGSTAFERGLLLGRNTLVPNNYAEVVRLFSTVLERNRTALSLVLASAMGQEMVSRRHVNRHLFHHMIAHSLHDERQGVSAVQVPTLILWGEADQVLHHSCVETFQQLIPHARVRKLADVGHLPMVDVPATTAKHLNRFWFESRLVK
ncbi:alpha/beta fold hydrolase [Agitococcus lubricus]|uniref:Pimeloyl-ACP methyl ester carboxylesterase n=1 Tax=Agitococcus lubricus TaxID=1077255 RepID=A0A2T5IWQ9_9GAMM|nr:alpha/beta fold hydrolase [Agitococcus lubricus]PTQ88334.1 pimeloyl-ACP methyl ester carboxylesterase [Agitococcus lubricus]